MKTETLLPPLSTANPSPPVINPGWSDDELEAQIMDEEENGLPNLTPEEGIVRMEARIEYLQRTIKSCISMLDQAADENDASKSAHATKILAESRRDLNHAKERLAYYTHLKEGRN